MATGGTAERPTWRQAALFDSHQRHLAASGQLVMASAHGGVADSSGNLILTSEESALGTAGFIA